MNFKANALAATAVAATLATAALAVSPAQAATLNGTLNLSSTDSFVNFLDGGVNIYPNSVDFFGGATTQRTGVNASLGSFQGAAGRIIGGGAQIKDINLSSLPSSSSPLVDFISNIRLANLSGFTFSLTSFNFTDPTPCCIRRFFFNSER